MDSVKPEKSNGTTFKDAPCEGGLKSGAPMVLPRLSCHAMVKHTMNEGCGSWWHRIMSAEPSKKNVSHL